MCPIPFILLNPPPPPLPPFTLMEKAYIEKGKNVSDALAEVGIAFSLLGQVCAYVCPLLYGTALVH